MVLNSCSNNNIYSGGSKLSKVIFVISLVMIMFRNYLISFAASQGPELVMVQKVLFYIPIILLFVFFVCDGDKKIVELIMFIVSVILYLLNREGSLLLLVLFAFSIKKLDDNYVVKSYLILSALFLCVSILLINLFPWIQNNNQVHYRFVNDGTDLATRLDFGLGNPNTAFFHLMPIYCAYIFLRYKNYNMLDRVILIVSAAFVYAVTMSRTGFAAVIIGLLLVEFIKRFDLKKFKAVTMIIKLLPVIFTVISIGIGIVLSKSELFNKLLSSRPRYWHVYLVEVGKFFKPFGNVFSGDIRAQNPLDSSYVYLITVLGLVAFVLISFVLYKGIDLLIKNDKQSYLVVIVIFLFYSFAENILLEVVSSFGVLLLIKQLIINSKKEVNIYSKFKK